MGELARKFIKYCDRNKLAKVNECLSRGVDVNTVSQSRPLACNRGQTALMVACKSGFSAIVSRLIEVPGLDLNYETEDGYTAAHLASGNGHTECVKILAKTGKVDWNKRDSEGKTPLFWALEDVHWDTVDIIVKQPNIDYNVKTEEGKTLAHCVPLPYETFANLETFDCWNVPDKEGNTPVMFAVKNEGLEGVEILLRCPRVDLSCRDKEGWSLVFRAIQFGYIDLVKMILSKLERPFTGSSLARIAVEVGEKEDVRRICDDEEDYMFDWNERVEGEDPAILWALKNAKFEVVDILMAVSKVNLQGDPSADLTIYCDSETFRVHKYFFSSKSPVFSAMLNSDMREAREGEIYMKDMNSSTISSMIHFIYTGELTDGWQELEIEDMASAADFYNLPDWMRLFCSKLRTEGEVSAARVAEMISAGGRYQYSVARELRWVARERIRLRREITEDPAFREKLRGDDALFELLALM